MKLVLFSGGYYEDNDLLNQKMIGLTQKEKPGITFIPSDCDGGPILFNEFVAYYSKFGIEDFYYFPVDVKFPAPLIKEALSRDIVYLSGGNTFHFLKYIRESRFSKHLKSFLDRGGVLAGLSAGSILMTPNIRTATFPKFDRDENEVKLKNFKSLELVEFEFFPHFVNSKRYNRELIRNSRGLKNPIIACPDGGGVVVNTQSDEMTFCGDNYVFFDGKRFKI